MPYYTFHMHMDVQHYVYQRNFCSLHSVHEVVHSEYPGKKRGLNIRILLMEKTIIIIAMYTFIKIPMHFKYCYLQKCIA